jgi:hypothetical protein
MVNTTGPQRPDRSTIGKSAGGRDYPMSIHIILFEKDGADEPNDCGFVRKYPDHVGTPPQLFVEAFEGICAVQLDAVLLGKSL